MAVFAVPTSSNLPWYSFQTVLSTVTYTLEMRYNQRMDRWVLQVQDAQGNVILAGVPLLMRLDVLENYRTLALPPGPLIAYDVAGSGVEPTLASFLTTHALLYVDPLS